MSGTRYRKRPEIRTTTQRDTAKSALEGRVTALSAVVELLLKRAPIDSSELYTLRSEMGLRTAGAAEAAALVTFDDLIDALEGKGKAACR